MQKPEPSEPSASKSEKKNLGAKIGVAFALGGVVGGKLSIPGLVMDANNLFPKGTTLGTKFKKTFSKEVLGLLANDMERQIEAGRSPLMASLASFKWSFILPTVGGIILGVIGWNRADRIQNSKDIIKHPIKSTKIILGLQEPDPVPKESVTETKNNSHASKVMAERAEQPAAARG